MLLSLHSSCEGTFFNTHNSNFLFGGILFGDPASFGIECVSIIRVLWQVLLRWFLGISEEGPYLSLS